jgi:hypothetical protein
MRGRWTWWTLALAAPLSAAEPERSAVVAVGQCNVAGSAISARTFRAALSQPGSSVQTETETAAPLGGLAQRTLPELNAALSSARSDFYADRVQPALATLKQALQDVQLLMPSEVRWATERDMLTFQAQIQLKTDHAAAEASLSQVMRVDANFKPDTSVYPPSFQRFADDVRKAVKKLPTNRLDISVSPPGKPVFIGGKPAGVAPLSLRLPVGDYRVEVDWGYRGQSRMANVGAPPMLPKTVEMAQAVEGAVAPDAGPCVQPRGGVGEALTRLLPVLGVSKVYGVRSVTSGTDQYVIVTEVSAKAQRTVRVKLPPGAPEGEALGMIAVFFHTGHSAPLLEILAEGAPDVPPVVVATPVPTTVVGAGAAPAGTVTQAAPRGSGLRTAGWVLGGVGVAGIAVGLVEFLSASSQKSDLTNSQVNGAFPAGTQSSFSSTNDSIKSKQTIAVIAGGVGAAALVTGVVFIIVGGNQSSSGVSVAPTVVPGGGGAVLAGSF